MESNSRRAQLRTYVEINPSTPEFRHIPLGTKVTFLPLEAIWNDQRFDASKTKLTSKDTNSYTEFMRGDVLLPKVSPTFSAGRSCLALIPSPVGLASSEVHVLRPRDGVDGRFIAYLTQAIPFLEEGEASQQGVGGLRRVSSGWVGQYPVAYFNSQQQRAIADYLDRETGQIDAMAAKLDDLIERLEERKEAVLENEYSRLSNEYPVVKAGFLVDANTGSGDTQDSSGEGYPFYVRSNTPLKADTWDFEGAAVLTAGDGAGVGRVFHRVAGRFKAHQRVYVLRNFRRVTRDYFYWIFKCDFPKQVEGGTAQSTVPSVRMHMITGTRIPLPPLDEQRRIADYLDEQTAKIDAMIVKAAQLKELLAERRSALITATVTGNNDAYKEF